MGSKQECGLDGGIIDFLKGGQGKAHERGIDGREVAVLERRAGNTEP